jgi:hypothetical protein
MELAGQAGREEDGLFGDLRKGRSEAGVNAGLRVALLQPSRSRFGEAPSCLQDGHIRPRRSSSERAGESGPLPLPRSQ